MNKKAIFYEIRMILLTIVGAALSAFGLHIFVYPAGFAPLGIDGIATMLQEVTGMNAGYYSLMFNIPLLLVAWFIIKKRFVIYTLLYTILSSIMLVILETVGFYEFQGTGELIIPAIFSGVILGVRTGLMIKIGASAGGIDIIAAMIQKKRPYLNIERTITLICYVITILSYFVYPNVTSILLSVVQMFIFDKFAGGMLKDSRNAIEVKIVTKEPDAIRNEIIYNLKHSATIVNARGMYSDDESTMIISVINIRQIPEFIDIIKNHPGTFAYYGELMGVKGNFRWKKDDPAI